MLPARFPLLLILLLGSVVGHAAEPRLAVDARQWAAERGEHYWLSAAAAEGSCSVVATEQGLAVLDRHGRTRWRRAYFNNWFKAGIAALAAGPGCAVVAVGGSSGYKQVWIVGPPGVPNRHVPGVRGTPTALRFDHAGSRLAIGTAAGQLSVVDRLGRRRGEARVGLRIDGLRYSPDDRWLLTTHGLLDAALLDAEARIRWTRSPGAWIEIEPTDDWQRFLIVGKAGHGSTAGAAELVTRDGKTLWHRAIASIGFEKMADGQHFRLRSVGPRDEIDLEGAEFVAPIVVDRSGRESEAMQ